MGRLDVYERSSDSKAAAIKAMCQECMGYDDGSTAAIRDCTSPACPLYPHRPYQRGGADEAQEGGNPAVATENEVATPVSYVDRATGAPAEVLDRSGGLRWKVRLAGGEEVERHIRQLKKQ